MERVKGIEPSLSAWEADVLPLNYTRMERKTGFEPATLALARRCSTPEPLPQEAIEIIYPSCTICQDISQQW